MKPSYAILLGWAAIVLVGNWPCRLAVLKASPSTVPADPRMRSSLPAI